MLIYLPVIGTAVGGEGWTGGSVFRLKENGPYCCPWFESTSAQLLWAHLLRARLFRLTHFSFRAIYIPLVSFQLMFFRLTPIFNPEPIGSCPFISHPFFLFRAFPLMSFRLTPVFHSEPFGSCPFVSPFSSPFSGSASFDSTSFMMTCTVIHHQ